MQKRVITLLMVIVGASLGITYGLADSGSTIKWMAE